MFIGGDPERGADAAGGAVRAHQQPRTQRAFAILTGNPHLACAVAIRTTEEARRPVPGQALDPGQARLQRVAEVACHHHLAERIAAVIGRLHQHPAEVTGAADVDAPDRAGRHPQFLHHPQRGQRVDGGVGKAEVALVEHRRQRAGRGRFHLGHVQAQAVQGDRQAGADQAAADDQHVVAAGLSVGEVWWHCAMLSASVPLLVCETMNSPDQAPRIALGPLLLAGLIISAALTRLLPQPPNFSPVIAIALFAGAYFANRRWAVLVPLAAMLVSDLALAATHGGIYLQHLASPVALSVYACILLSTLLGFGLRGKVSGGRVLGGAVAGSVLFFAVTNFMVWLGTGPTSANVACQAGLAPCYAAAIPFFHWTLLGTLFWSAVLFGGFELLRRRVPALRAQTA